MDLASPVDCKPITTHLPDCIASFVAVTLHRVYGKILSIDTTTYFMITYNVIYLRSNYEIAKKALELFTTFVSYFE